MDYTSETGRSRELAERLQQVMPGGNTRTTVFYPPYPLALERGSGCYVWDVDGNEFVDYVNNYTSLIHGHAHPAIVAAIATQAAQGSAMSSPTVRQAELAERMCARFGAIERLRFTNSGSEANMIAVRVARAFTGRDAIVKAYDAYHGSWEQVSVYRQPLAGVPQAVRGLVHRVEYDDVDALQRTMEQHGREIAAIILDPLGEGARPGSRAFFGAARALADEYGALLIFDEVVSARLAPGGYQEVLGVRPDLTTLGKIIGGGLPVGAVGGRADVMALFDPRRPDAVLHPGTYNGNDLTMAAGCVALDLLTPDEYTRINALGESLAARLRDLFATHGLDAAVGGVGSLITFNFVPADGQSPAETLARFHLAALAEGVYVAPRGLMNISTPMDEVVMANTVAALDRALTRLAEPAAVSG